MEFNSGCGQGKRTLPKPLSFQSDCGHMQSSSSLRSNIRPNTMYVEEREGEGRIDFTEIIHPVTKQIQKQITISPKG